MTKTTVIFNLNDSNLEIIDKQFEAPVVILYDELKKVEENKVNFKRCLFKKGINFKLNITDLEIRKLQLDFQDCLIGENENEWLINSNRLLQTFMISFNSCVINNFTIGKCQFTNISIYQSLFSSGLIISGSEISIISIRNSLGHFVLTDNTESRIQITYYDDNLFLKDRLTRFIVKKLIQEQSKDERTKIESIISYKTIFNLSNNENSLITFKKSDQTGFKRDQKNNNLNEIPYYLQSDDIKKLNISVSLSFKDNSNQKVQINKGYFNSLTLKGESNSRINIKHVLTNQLYIHDFQSSKLLFYDFGSLNGSSKLEIKNSNLSNTWFNKAQLKDFETVSIYNTTLEKTVFSATSFPKNIEALENIHIPSQKESEYFNNQYENYKQLKLALANQSDQVQTLQMHQKMYEAIRKSKTISFQDKFILFLNYWSNKHGTSIKYAFFNFIIVLTLLVILYNLSLPEAPYSFGWNGFDSFFFSISETSKFILSNWKNAYTLANPTHRISSLISDSANGELSPMNYIISFFSRILIGWAYFQFISAFRKFGKKI